MPRGRELFLVLPPDGRGEVAAIARTGYIHESRLRRHGVQEEREVEPGLGEEQEDTAPAERQSV